MVDRHLVDYIKAQLGSGYSQDAITKVLRQQGWSDSEIHEGFQTVNFLTPRQKEVPKPHERNRNMGITEKIRRSLFHSDEFFEDIRGEPLSKAFVYYAIIMLIPTAVALVVMVAITSIMSTIFTTVAMPDSLGLLGLFAWLGPLIVVLAYVGNLFGTFINAAIIHLFAKIYSAKGSYRDTYQSLVYSTTPVAIFFFIPVINGLWALYLNIKGLSILHRISMGRATLILFTPIILAIIIAVIIFTAFASGLAGYQNSGISGLQGFSSPSDDWYLSESDFMITLTNDFGNSINITDSVITYLGHNSTSVFVNNALVGDGNGVVIPSGSPATFVYNIDGETDPDKTYILFITITHKSVASGFESTSYGMIIGKTS